MAKDFVRDSEGKLLIQGGRFVFGEADEQHLAILSKSELGDFGINALLGGRLRRTINARYTDIERGIKHLKLQLLMDNWKNSSVSVESDLVSVNGTR